MMQQEQEQQHTVVASDTDAEHEPIQVLGADAETDEVHELPSLLSNLAPSEWPPAAPSESEAWFGESEDSGGKCPVAAPVRRLRSAADFAAFACTWRAGEQARAVTWASGEPAENPLVSLLSQVAGSARLVCAADVAAFARERAGSPERLARWADKDASESSSSSEEGDARCPSGHVLSACKASELFEVACDACRGACRAGAKLLSCRPCNYDVHARCADSHSLRPRGADGSRRRRSAPAPAEAPAEAPAVPAADLPAVPPVLDARIVVLLRALLTDMGAGVA